MMQRLLDPFRLDPRLGATSLRLTRDVFVRGLALVHLIAFVSLWVQVHGLIGAEGILPAAPLGTAAFDQLGVFATFTRAPSLFWAWPTDTMLDVLCAAGVAASAAALVGVFQGPLLLLLWVLYLSLFHAGQLFLGFQWDLLLIETTFLSLFVAPWRAWAAGAPEPSPLAITLLRLLLLKVMVLSGLAKLWSGDPTWRDLTALTYHWWTQPLPNPVSWYAWLLPGALQRAAVAITLLIEVVLPFGMFFDRRGRIVAFCGTTLLMVLLELTGNFGFFNLLTIVLALTLLDDGIYHRVSRIPLPTPRTVRQGSEGHPWRAWLVGTVATFLLVLNAMVLDANFRGPLNLARWEQRALLRVHPLRTINSYGLFAKMTTERPVIAIEGTVDGETWRPYRFRYQVGDPDRMPPIVAPHMPRLDWAMWFAALGPCEGNPWFVDFEDALLAGSEPVRALLGEDPFAGARPVAIRTHVYRYTFAEPGAGAWWTVTDTEHQFCEERSR